MITVPCCIRCNVDGSVNDEYFKTYLGMHVAHKGGEAERLYKERVLPTTKHNRRLRQTIIRAMRPVFLSTKSGIIYDKGVEIVWDSDVHDKAIERIARGLFYHHYKKPLLKIVDINIHWGDSPVIYNMLALEGCEHNSIANGTFKYYHGATEDGSGSMWAFSFYNGHFAGAMITTEDFGFDETGEL